MMFSIIMMIIIIMIQPHESGAVAQLYVGQDLNAEGTLPTSQVAPSG
jgi:preprotein translocase subunit SecG